MKRLLQMSLVLIVMFSSVSSVKAVQSPGANVDPATIAYFKTNDYQRHLYNLGLYWDRQMLKIETECLSKYQLNPMSFNILRPLTFGSSSSHPVEGTWTFRFKFTRCNSTIVYNAYAVAQQGNKPKLVALVPGTTLTDPQLLRDVFTGGVSSGIATKAKDKSCKDTYVLNTRVSKKPHILEEDGRKRLSAWQEEWLVKHCDEKIPMSFCFAPSPKGGTQWTLGGCK